METSLSSPEPLYRLLPTLRSARLGRHHSFYDELAKAAPIVFVPTRRAPERAFEVVRVLQAANPANEPWPLERLRALFADAAGRERAGRGRPRGLHSIAALKRLLGDPCW